MRLILKVLLRIVVIAIQITVIIFGIRWVQTNRYSEYIATDEENVYVEPANLALYETEQANMTVETIKEGYVIGFHLVPDEILAEGAIFTFGGSEGSPNYELAVQLANEGYEVYSLFFFGPGESPESIHEVPLDFYQEVLAYHEEHSQSDGPITVLGASKGAELTLNLATIYEEIDHIVLYAPSAYNFFSLDQQNADASSWSYQDEPLPHLSNQSGSMIETMQMIVGFITYTPVSYQPIYDSVIEGSETESLEAARIKAEEFTGEGIIFAGGDDLMWNSSQMGEAIIEQANQIELHNYPEAGHLFSNKRYLGDSAGLIALGGNDEANQAALEESHAILLENLANWHNK